MDAKRCAVAHPEIKFGQITGQMLLTHMLISPDQAPLENGEKALGGMAAGRSCFALTGICLVMVHGLMLARRRHDKSIDRRPTISIPTKKRQSAWTTRCAGR